MTAVSAVGLATIGARTCAGTVMIVFESYIHMVQALERVMDLLDIFPHILQGCFTGTLDSYDWHKGTIDW